ncbi:hypothetical protein E2C01_091099 [Portunus trituberculatus]|uniref:Uncharacterized protein n=1 Tax=Portunus trituberculatus TaxID=210409 RepID=A0A5B7JGH4_PORTR|nr:hypothetical protein [Portunus trituberculatus]
MKQEEFMNLKCNNYTADISNYEANLNKVGMTSNITHQALATQWAELQKLEKQVCVDCVFIYTVVFTYMDCF